MPRNSKRSRLFSESASTDQHHHEALKGILKNSRIPTKRSVSECVDDLSQFMDDLEINIDDLKSRRFCSLHPFPEQVEYEEYSCGDDEDDDDDDDDVDDDDDDDSHDGDFDCDYENQDESDDDHDHGDINEKEEKKCIDRHKKQIVIDTGVKTSNKLSERDDNNLENLNQEFENKNNGSLKNNSKQRDSESVENNNNNNIHDDETKQVYSDHKKKFQGCACYDRYRSDSSNGSNYSDTTKPRKKSVRFDDHVYETVYIASRLYDRRAMAKYRFSSRHHPPPNGKQQSKKQSKKRTAKLSKSETKPTTTPIITSKRISDDKSLFESVKQSEAQTNGCRLTKSQRSKQSKKDKLKMKMRRKEESCSSDDQGYGSSVLNFSD